MSASDDDFLSIPIPDQSGQDDSTVSPEGVSEMATEDLTPAIQALSQGRLAHSMQRQSDMVDLYAEDARRHFLLEEGKLNYADATAVRHVEESGSGVARQLNPFMYMPATAVKSA